MNILLVVPDNESHINSPSLGVPYLVSYLKKRGHFVAVFNQDIYHFAEGALTETLNRFNFDWVGVGFIGSYHHYRQIIKISLEINKAKRKPFFVLGGHGPAPEPEYFLKLTGADVVVLGEGEKTFCDLIEESTSWSRVKGIAYIDNGKFVRTEARELIVDLDSLPFPYWNAGTLNHYVLSRELGCSSYDRVLPMITSRGCPYKCNFCFRLDKGCRLRSIGNIVDEILYLKKEFDITTIRFGDELLMSSAARTTALCETLLSRKIGIKWTCCGRLNFASKELLTLMKRAGCLSIFYGVESLNDLTLKTMGKHLTVDQIVLGTERTIAAGIIPSLSVIFGNIGETEKTLKKGVKFLKKYNTPAQLRTIGPVTPYPGSPLYYYAIKNGLLKGVADFYEKHTNPDLLSVNFTKLSDARFYACLKEANRDLVKDYYTKNLKVSLQKVATLYDTKDFTFRGFRQT